MPKTTPFKGFSPETIRFFEKLKTNNNKAWFEKNRDVYEKFVLRPSKSFVEAVGEKLREFAPKIIAVPKVNGSLFRINRDTRFSADKSPYKTYMGILFWEGLRQKMESSGYYFHLETPNIMLAAGLYKISRPLLERYRNHVVDPERGADLAAVLARIEKMKGVSIGGQYYKRVPSGFDPEHSNARWLLHNGLYASWEGPVPDEFTSEKFIGFCIKHFKNLAPLHDWLKIL
ncbi:MAG: DUF2461 domain-containing protein [Candidatus Aminicenantes bacterium]|nr:DUF2461 domain-containing protein [Candidatus Aminicenantes bacterium]